MFNSPRATALARFVLLYAVMYSAFGVASPFLPAFVSGRGLAPEQLGLVLGAGTAVRLISSPLAGRIGTVAAAAVAAGAADSVRPIGGLPHREVLTGVDVLKRDGFQQLHGRRVGLITNHTGADREGLSTVQILYEADDVNLKVLFSPEHGFEGVLDVAKIDDAEDKKTGLKIISLYGETRTPTAESLAGLDALVFDIQDAGVRYYTYATTMAYAMEEAAKAGVAFVVLDRPNPLNGARVEGPLLDADRLSFEGYFSLPLRHGMTLGELARLANRELSLGAALTVVPADGWSRAHSLLEIGLPFVPPSPNLKDLESLFHYPGTCLFEGTALSVGRGTEASFRQIGAPWLDNQKLVAEMNHAMEIVGYVNSWSQPINTRVMMQDTGIQTPVGIKVKGKDTAVRIYEPLGLEGDLDKKTQDELKLWHQTLRAYRSQQWDQAEVSLLNLKRMNPECELYEVYADRIVEKRKNPPPPDWDGVTAFDEK